MPDHTWRFFRSGAVDQVRLETSDDLRNLPSLDPKLWVALASPVAGLEIDEKTMRLLDTDGDGRVRVPEILAAVAFVCERLADPSLVIQSSGPLLLSSLAETPQGKAVAASARTILASRGKADASEITIEDAGDTEAIFKGMPLNGDGIVPASAAADDATKATIADVIKTLGAERDRTGEDGVSLPKVEKFFEACTAFALHHQSGAKVSPLGIDATDKAHQAVAAVRAKVDDYFARVRVAAFDARAEGALNRADADYVALATKDLSAACGETEAFPLSRVGAGRALSLRTGINPAWATRMQTFIDHAVTPLLGDRSELDEKAWDQMGATLAPYALWKADPIGNEVASLGVPRVEEILKSDGKAKIQALIEADLLKKPEAEAIGDVERLVRYRRDLGRILRNFVSFTDFYGRRVKAVFQAGTLYFDQRSCDLVLQVHDAARHAILAGHSGCYLAYFDCVRKSDGLKVTMCAAVTDGDSDNLMVGRNGLFYDIKGRDYDATITKIVDNPISLRQAFWSPYKKFLRMVEDFVAKRAAAASAASDAKMTSAAEKVATADQTAAPAAAPAPAPSTKIDVGAVAAIGVAVGGITAAMGALLDTFFGLGFWMPLGIVGLILLISGPSVVIAALKLRRRNIGPILDADGWALNAQARINVPFGRSLTRLAALPPGSNRDLRDPYADESPSWPWLLGILLFLLVVLGALVMSGSDTYTVYRSFLE